MALLFFKKSEYILGKFSQSKEKEIVYFRTKTKEKTLASIHYIL